MAHRELEIRPLQEAEVQAVGARLGLARLHQGDGFYLVAWVGPEPAGHLHLALSDPPELQDVSVRPEYRRAGLARALTGAAEEHLRLAGHRLVRLQVSVDNAAAQSLYRACGYLESGLPPRRVQGTIEIRTGPIVVDDTLLVWQKALD